LVFLASSKRCSCLIHLTRYSLIFFIYLNQRSGYNLILWANVRTEGKLCNPQGGGERSRPAAWPRLSKVDRRAEFALVFWVRWHPGTIVTWGLDEWLISRDVWRICLRWRR
jgi:hypothetical protein